MIWLLGIFLFVLAVALVLCVALWFDACPRCRSARGPVGVSWRDTALEHIVQRKCRKCGHTWEIRNSVVE